MENKNTNFDVLDLLDKQLEVESLQEPNISAYSDSIDILGQIGNTQTFQSHIDEYKENILAIVDLHANIPINTVSNGGVKTIMGSVIGNIIFGIKYITTSAGIFAFLLIASNYSAYFEIARSYLNPEQFNQNRMNLLSSVQNTKVSPDENILSEEEKKESTEEKIKTVQNKTYHSMDKLINGAHDQAVNMAVEIVPYENRVVIPKIAKNIPLVEVQNKPVDSVKELENIFMDELANGIIRYPGSAKPGEIGNSFIFGHSSNFPWVKGDYNDVFALLDNVVFGDEVIVYYGQKKFTYKIREKSIIKPGDVSILKRNKGKSEITLMTCWPIGTTLNRMIVIGELVE